MTRERVYFAEPECEIGGAHCPMWERWFMACEDADPGARDANRDPAEIANFPFIPAHCAHQDTCVLFGRNRAEGIEP